MMPFLFHVKESGRCVKCAPFVENGPHQDHVAIELQAKALFAFY